MYIRIVYYIWMKLTQQRPPTQVLQTRKALCWTLLICSIFFRPSTSFAESIPQIINKRSIGIGVGSISGKYKDDTYEIALSGKSGVLLNHTFVEEGNMTFTINVSGFQLKSVVHPLRKYF